MWKLGPHTGSGVLTGHRLCQDLQVIFHARTKPVPAEAGSFLN